MSVTRSRISVAALLVKVIARMAPAATAESDTRCAIRLVSTRVLPDPAPATTSTGEPLWITAAYCCGLRPCSHFEALSGTPGRDACSPGLVGVLDGLAGVCGSAESPGANPSSRASARCLADILLPLFIASDTLRYLADTGELHFGYIGVMLSAVRTRTWRIIKYIAGTLLAAQALAIAWLTLVSSVRKRRPPTGFPSLAPLTATTRDSDVTIYTYGEDVYADMLSSIENAKNYIYFESFIWKSDTIGERFKTALTAAARRGVQVYVVYDRFANLVVNPSFYEFDKRIHAFAHPLVGPASIGIRRNGRNHRKLLVVDGEVGFLGGYNIGSLYARWWRDTHARVTGIVVSDLVNAFVDYWNLYHEGEDRLASPRERAWDSSVAIYRNLPKVAVYPIRNMYLDAIDRAAERVWLTQAYLLPDEDFVRALAEAVSRGVDVRIIVPTESNHVVADWLSRGYYDRLLREGIRLFLYQDAMVHAKTALVDNMWATIGTANIDRLSMLGNLEINAEFKDAGVNSNLATIFERDLEQSEEIVLSDWSKRSAVAKATERLLAPLRPLF